MQKKREKLKPKFLNTRDEDTRFKKSQIRLQEVMKKRSYKGVKMERLTRGNKTTEHT